MSQIMTTQLRPTIGSIRKSTSRLIRKSVNGLSRRDFVQVLGAGLLITVSGEIALAQRPRWTRRRGPRRFRRPQAREHRRAAAHRSRRHDHRDDEQGRGGARFARRNHPGRCGRIAMDPARVRLIMADTALTPDDGMTAGSGTTPRTVPRFARGGRRASCSSIWPPSVEHGPRRTASTGRRDPPGIEKTQDQLRRTGTGGRFCQDRSPGRFRAMSRSRR